MWFLCVLGGCLGVGRGLGFEVFIGCGVGGWVRLAVVFGLSGCGGGSGGGGGGGMV